jgi:hypothetical protein
MSPRNPLYDVLVNSANRRSVDTDVEGDPEYFIPNRKRVTFDPDGSVKFPPRRADLFQLCGWRRSTSRGQV